MDIVNAFEQVGTYRGAAVLCGTTHHTVRRVIEANRQGLPADRGRKPAKPRNTDAVRGLIAEKVKATDGRITAKRLLPAARAAGYLGSARNFRRAVAAEKAEWKRQGRTYRPWVATLGEHLVIDWTTEGGWQVFCAELGSTTEGRACEARRQRLGEGSGDSGSSSASTPHRGANRRDALGHPTEVSVVEGPRVSITDTAGAISVAYLWHGSGPGEHDSRRESAR
jgi:hypothetical protein